MKIAVFLPNWLGDVVMATPTLRALRRRFGDARIVGIMRPYLTGVLSGTDWLTEQWAFDRRSKQKELRRWALVKRMHRERFDLAVLLPNSFGSAMVAWLGGARRRLGYVRDGRALLLTDRLEPPRAEGRHVESPMVDYYLALAAAAGCPDESRRLELHVTPAEDASGREVYGRLGLGEGRVIALNSGSSNGEARSWPAENFAQLARRIADRLDHQVLVMCGPKERAVALEIAQRAGSGVHSMADQPLDLGTAKACLARTRLMVSTDSGPRHVAAALGRPVITLRGPTLPVWSENPTVEAIDLRLELDCIGCRQQACPLGHHRCMRDLPVEMVYEAVQRMLRQASDAPPGAPGQETPVTFFRKSA
jgi:heptosyltransferase II